MEEKRNFFFRFIEKECETLRYAESQEGNFEINKKDVRRTDNTFAGREAHGRESQGSKSTSKFKKKDIPKFPCPIGVGDKINYWAASDCYQFRYKMSKKELMDRRRKYGLCGKCLK